MQLERFKRAIVRYAGEIDPRTFAKYLRGEFPQPLARLLLDPDVLEALLADLREAEQRELVCTE
jgi:hypothetical protein